MKTRISLWQWPNVLALDAAAIAVAWQAVFASQLPGGPGGSGHLVLALSVWLTYQADRLLDVGGRADAQIKSARHRFAKNAHGLLWKIWFALLGLDLLIAFLGLSAGQLMSGFALLFFCLIYTVLNQKLSKHFFPKELCVAAIFTGGTQVFLPDRVDGLSTLTFALLCLANCLIIAQKEKAVDARLEVRSLSFWIHPRAPHALVYLALLCSLFSVYRTALLPTALCMGWLQLHQQEIETEQFRVLCDASLLVGPVLHFFFFVMPRY
jgi:hypothetical protein